MTEETLKGAQMMTIQDVAKKTGISVYTIRFYEQRGLLPPVPRSSGGIRQFREADITFLQFLLDLKRTGMSLEEMAAFTADGCLLEQIQQGSVPAQPVERRIALLRAHAQRVLEQRQHLDHLLETIAQKVAFYEEALEPRHANVVSLPESDPGHVEGVPTQRSSIDASHRVF